MQVGIIFQLIIMFVNIWDWLQPARQIVNHVILLVPTSVTTTSAVLDSIMIIQASLVKVWFLNFTHLVLKTSNNC